MDDWETIRDSPYGVQSQKVEWPEEYTVWPSPEWTIITPGSWHIQFTFFGEEV